MSLVHYLVIPMNYTTSRTAQNCPILESPDFYSASRYKMLPVLKIYFQSCCLFQALKPLGIGVATGEQCQNRVMFKQFLQAGALQYCQIDSCRVGSVNENISIILMANKFGGMYTNRSFNMLNYLSKVLDINLIHYCLLQGCWTILVL